RIDFGFHMLGRRCANSPPIGRYHRGFNGANDYIFGELFFLQDLIESQSEFVLCHSNCSVYSCITSRKVGVAHFSMRTVISSSVQSYFSTGQKKMQGYNSSMTQRNFAKAALRGEPSYVWRAGQQRRFDMIIH